MTEAVLNWIAQGLAVAAVTAGGLRLLGPGRAHARYLASWTSLWVVVCLPVVPVLWAAQRLASDGPLGEAAPAGLLSVPQGAWNAPVVLGGLLALWIGGQSARLVAAARALLEARRQCQPLPEPMLARLDPTTRARLASAGIQLASSTDVRAAAVLGLGSPIIAVHPALLAQLSDAQLDQVVVHEWAHVVRRDARATLVQQLVGTLVGWHPAVWWTNRRIHREREMACDEMVVALTGAPRAYAECLTHLAALTRAAREAQLAVGAVGTSGLRRRVLQVLAWDGRQSSAARIITPAFVALLLGLALGVGNMRVFSAAMASAALLEAESLVALAGAVQAPIVTPEGPVDSVDPVAPRAGTRLPRTEPAGISRVRAATVGTIQHAAGSIDTPTGETAGTAVPSLPPDEPLAAFSVPLVPGLLQAPAGTGTAQAPRIPAQAVDVWNAAAEAGGRIGRTSQKGATTTAGFFTRVAKNVARSF